MDNLINGNPNLINKDTCSLEIAEIGRRAYVNSNSGRAELLADCTEHDAMDVYDEVMTVWGETPTVEDELVPVKTFDELKHEKLNELNTEFNQRVSGSFTTTEGYNMQFDTSDSLKMQGAITLMESLGTTSGYITQADDTTIYNISITTMKAVLIQMLSAYAQCHARKQELRSLINNAQTKEELNEITISWPI